MRPAAFRRSSSFVTLTLATCVAGLGQVEIHNECNRKVFQDAVLADTAVSSGFTPAHDVHTYNYGPIADGLSVKIGYDQQDVTNRPFQIEVTRNYSTDGKEQVYYDVSSLNGNPFYKHNRAVIPSDPSCQHIICPKGKRVCTDGSYHRGESADNNPVMMCGADTTLAVYLCSLGK